MGKKQNLSDFTSDITDGTLPWTRIVDDQKNGIIQTSVNLLSSMFIPYSRKLKKETRNEINTFDVLTNHCRSCV